MVSPSPAIEKRFQLTVSVHLVLQRGDEILLIRRKNTGFDDGCYALVSGCIDGDESATHAMIREAQEEVGITLNPKDLNCSCVMHQKRDDWEGISLFFLAKNWKGEVSNGEPNKCDDVQFYPQDRLPENLVPYVKSGIDSTLQGGPLFTEYGWSSSI